MSVCVCARVDQASSADILQIVVRGLYYARDSNKGSFHKFSAQ